MPPGESNGVSIVLCTAVRQCEGYNYLVDKIEYKLG